MSSKRLEQFPDVEAKLQKPTKVSAFEQQKAHAEAKRKREAAETAAVYEEFVKSFDRDDNDDHRGARERRPSPGRLERPGGFGAHAPFVGASGKRHFGRASAAGPGMKSGPGSLGPAPLTFGRKRTRDASSDRRERDEGRARLGFEDQEPLSVSKAFQQQRRRRGGCGCRAGGGEGCVAADATPGKPPAGDLAGRDQGAYPA